MKLRGRTEAPDWSRGRTLSPSARGDTTDSHGPLQRLLGGRPHLHWALEPLIRKRLHTEPPPRPALAPSESQVQADDNEGRGDRSHDLSVEGAALFPGLYVLVHLLQRAAVGELRPPDSRGGEKSP